MRSGGRWAVAAALLAGVAFAWPTYVRYFGLHPRAMIAALFIAFAMYLPSLWAMRFLDRHEPEPPPLLIEPVQTVGIDLTNSRDESPLGAALLVYSAVANTVVMNLLVWPVLAWGILCSRNPEVRR